MIFLPRWTAAITTLAADSNVRFAMAGIRIRELPDGHWRLDATDGRVLGIIRGESDPSPPDEAAAQKLPAPESITPEVVLQSKDLAAAFKGLPKAEKKGPQRTLGIMLSRPEVMLVAGQSVSPATPAHGYFPDTDSALPRGPARFSILVNPDLLIDLLRVAKALPQAEGETPKVELLFWSASKPLGVVSRCGSLFFDGILMPLDPPKTPPQAPTK